MSETLAAPRSEGCVHVLPSRELPDIGQDIRQHLLGPPPRSIPCKYFYDDRGSRLFERLCETSEYYPTRTEDALLRDHAPEIISKTGPAQILELGSGNSHKTRHLLDACEQQELECCYAPFDVSKGVLLDTSATLRAKYGWLDVAPLLGDYNAGLKNLPRCADGRLFVFLGGTIGNLRQEEAYSLLCDIRDCMQGGDHLLLGADRAKETDVLNAAYNDTQGLTADFNLNMLQVLNREVGANFKRERFSHHARYNESLEQVETHLISEQDQEVRFESLDETLRLFQGEKILTEISRKFTYRGLHELLESCGLQVDAHYQPANRYFSLVLAGLPKSG